MKINETAQLAMSLISATRPDLQVTLITSELIAIRDFDGFFFVSPDRVRVSPPSEAETLATEGVSYFNWVSGLNPVDNFSLLSNYTQGKINKFLKTNPLPPERSPCDNFRIYPWRNAS